MASNLTQKIIPEEVESVLKLGPKFCFAPTKIPLQRIITDVEYAISKCKATSEEKQETRIKVANHLRRVCNSEKYHRKRRTQNMDPNERTKQFLQENDDILILKADKGNATVLMDKSEYHQKVLDLLENKNTYMQISDPTSRLERENNDIVKELYKKKYIDRLSRTDSLRIQLCLPGFMDYQRYTRQMCLYDRWYLSSKLPIMSSPNLLPTSYPTSRMTPKTFDPRPLYGRISGQYRSVPSI